MPHDSDSTCRIITYFKALASIGLNIRICPHHMPTIKNHTYYNVIILFICAGLIYATYNILSMSQNINSDISPYDICIKVIVSIFFLAILSFFFHIKLAKLETLNKYISFIYFMFMIYLILFSIVTSVFPNLNQGTIFDYLDYKYPYNYLTISFILSLLSTFICFLAAYFIKRMPGSKNCVYFLFILIICSNTMLYVYFYS